MDVPDGLEQRLLAAGRVKAGASHHRLPQFYLRQWAGRDGRLLLIDPATGEESRPTPKQAFAEEDYYTVVDDNLEPTALAEELYAVIENDAARVHRRLVNGVDPASLNVEDRVYYAAFLAAEVTRGEAFREFDRELAEKVGGEMLKIQASRPQEEWDRIRAEAAERGEELPEMTDELRESILRGDVVVQHSDEFRLLLSLKGVPELSYVLADMTWHLVDLPEPWLLTCEHPVTYWRPWSPADQFMGIGPMTSDEVRFPVSPSVALVLTHPRFMDKPRRGRGVRETAERLNFWTVFFEAKRPIVLNPNLKHVLPTGSLQALPGAEFGRARGRIITN